MQQTKGLRVNGVDSKEIMKVYGNYCYLCCSTHIMRKVQSYKNIYEAGQVSLFSLQIKERKKGSYDIDLLSSAA